MPARHERDELAKRRRLLVLETGLHRAALRAEASRIRDGLGWVTQTRSKLRAAAPWFALAAAVAGVVAAGRWRRLASWIPAGIAAWRFGRGLSTSK